MSEQLGPEDHDSGAEDRRLSTSSRWSEWGPFLTWPNGFTLLRLVCIPVFVWLLFGRDDRASAAWLLGGLGATDWVDGWMARKFDQASEFGAMLDPIVDRLLFFVAVPCLLIDQSMPILVAGLALGRELVTVVLAIAAAWWRGNRLVVSREGKTGAFLLMFAVPMFLGANSSLSYAPILEWLAWIFAVPGLVFSWFSALFQYLPAVRHPDRSLMD